MVTGIFLVLGIFSRAAAFTLSSLLVVFIIAISINLIRGVDFNCGCFVTVAGKKSDPVGLLIRDFLIYCQMGMITYSAVLSELQKVGPQWLASVAEPRAN